MAMFQKSKSASVKPGSIQQPVGPQGANQQQATTIQQPAAQQQANPMAKPKKI